MAWHVDWSALVRPTVFVVCFSWYGTVRYWAFSVWGRSGIWDMSTPEPMILAWNVETLRASWRSQHRKPISQNNKFEVWKQETTPRHNRWTCITQSSILPVLSVHSARLGRKVTNAHHKKARSTLRNWKQISIGKAIKKPFTRIKLQYTQQQAEVHVTRKTDTKQSKPRNKKNKTFIHTNGDVSKKRSSCLPTRLAPTHKNTAKNTEYRRTSSVYTIYSWCRN